MKSKNIFSSPFFDIFKKTIALCVIFSLFVGNLPVQAATPNSDDAYIRDFFEELFGTRNPDFKNQNYKINGNKIQDATIGNNHITGMNYLKLSACPDNNILIFSGSTWSCMNANSLGMQSISVGNFLTGNGKDVALNVDTSKIQKRIWGTCESGKILTGIAEDGSVSCTAFVEGDADSTNEIQNVMPGKGLQRDGSNSFGLMNCSDGEILKYNAVSGQWGCSVLPNLNETDPTVNALAKENLNCTAWQVPKFDQANNKWVCEKDSKLTDEDIAAMGYIKTANETDPVWIAEKNNYSLKTETDILFGQVKNFAKADLPTCSDGQVLRNNNGNLECVNGSGDGVEQDPKIGNLMVNIFPKWNGATLSNSGIFENAFGDVGIGTTLPSGKLHVSDLFDLNALVVKNGTVGIGLALPNSTFKLDVAGKIQAASTLDTDSAKTVTTKDYVDAKVSTGIAGIVEKDPVWTAAKGNYYLKTETDEKYPLKTDVYTKTESDASFGLFQAFTKVALPTCTNGQVLKSDGTNFVCVVDAGIDEEGITALGFLKTETDPSVNALGKATLSCADGQIAKWNGTVWACADDTGGIATETDPKLFEKNLDKITVLADGKTGIGTATPAEKLEISGAIKIGDALTASAGTIRWTGTDFEGNDGTKWVSLTKGGSETVCSPVSSSSFATGNVTLSCPSGKTLQPSSEGVEWQSNTGKIVFPFGIEKSANQTSISLNCLAGKMCKLHAICCGTSGVTPAEENVPSAVNGGWTEWSNEIWGSCSASCGGGTQTRNLTRTCTNPTPAGGGSDCSSLDGGNASKTESQSCNTQSCPLACGSGGTCNGGETFTFKGKTYGTIKTTTGQVWLDRNLGANQVCTSVTDSACYGDYYQWGRPADGHEKSNSGKTLTLATSIVPGNAQFIRSGTSPYDWTIADATRTERQTFLGKTDGTGVCPIGFHIPTKAEILAENFGKISTAFARIKIPQACKKETTSGTIECSEPRTYMWTSDNGSQSPSAMIIDLYNDTYINSYTAADAMTLRCIATNETSVNYTYSWSQGDWGTCSATCGTGTQGRTVECKRNDGTVVADSNCTGTKPVASQSCNTQLCPINGGWSEWSNVGSCNVFSGKQQQSRSCTNPAPQNGGLDCGGELTQEVGCTVNAECGNANLSATTEKPTTNLCSAGSEQWLDVNGIDGNWNWTCAGYNTGTSANCSANVAQIGMTISADGSGISGFATANSTVEIFANGISVGTTTAGANGSYSFTGLILTAGQTITMKVGGILIDTKVFTAPSLEISLSGSGFTAKPTGFHGKLGFAYDDTNPQIAALPDGGYAVTWIGGNRGDSTNRDIYTQRFNSSGVALGNIQTLYGSANRYDEVPQITAVGTDGSYVVAWWGKSVNGNNYEIYTQKFDSNGIPTGNTQALHGVAGNYGDISPQITAVGTDGSYVVTWIGVTNSNNNEIYVQKFNSSGVASGSMQTLHGAAGDYADITPQITAVGTDGSYAITWVAGFSFIPSVQSEIYTQKFDANNFSISGTQRIIGVTFQPDETPQITAVGTDGSYVVTWTGGSNDNNREIYTQKFNASGMAIGSKQTIHGVAGGNYIDISPQIMAVGTDGSYIVAWQGGSATANTTGVYTQRFDALGEPTGTIKTIQAPNANWFAENPQITAIGTDGSYVVVWSSGFSGSSGYYYTNTLWVQKFDATDTAIGSARSLMVNDVHSPQVAAVSTDGSYVVTWSGDINNANGLGIYTQKFDSAGIPVNSDGSASTGNFVVHTTLDRATYDSTTNYTVTFGEGTLTVAGTTYASGSVISASVWEAANTAGTILISGVNSGTYSLKVQATLTNTSGSSTTVSATKNGANYGACGYGGICSGGENLFFKGKIYGTIKTATGQVWLDRNLGANQVCTSATDSACYGDYYQWGRPADGHQLRTSATSSTKATSIVPGIAQFIIGFYDWTTADADGSQRAAFLAKTDGTGVCPTGFHVPTETEITSLAITSVSDAFTKLKLPLAGFHFGSSMDAVHYYAYLWSSNPPSPPESRVRALFLNGNTGLSNWTTSYQSNGFSLRCVQ